MRKASNFDGSVYKPSRHLPAKTPDRRQQHSSGVFVNFEHVNAGWEYKLGFFCYNAR